MSATSMAETATPPMSSSTLSHESVGEVLGGTGHQRRGHFPRLARPSQSCVRLPWWIQR